RVAECRRPSWRLPSSFPRRSFLRISPSRRTFSRNQVEQPVRRPCLNRLWALCRRRRGAREKASLPGPRLRGDLSPSPRPSPRGRGGAQCDCDDGYANDSRRTTPFEAIEVLVEAGPEFFGKHRTGIAGGLGNAPIFADLLIVDAIPNEREGRI